MISINSVSTKNHIKNKKLLVLIISIVLIVVLFTSSLFIVYKLIITNVDFDDGDGVWDVVLDGAVFVGSEGELVVAVAEAGFGVSTVIVLNRDVALNGSLVISEGKNVTLTSRGRFGGGFFGLFGADGERVVVVEGGGWLCVNGVVISHEVGVVGGGVTVEAGGEFVLVKGKISGNILDAGKYGGGVYNEGKFRMIGGEISNNNASESGSSWYHGLTTWFAVGGGVYNCEGGVFEMYGGSIHHNIGQRGGGVCNVGNFSMLGGLIAKNTSGGVLNKSVFSMFGGSIANNEFGGVDNQFTFSMFGGSIIKNTVGGGMGNSGVFTMWGGLIANNIAERSGGGVYSSGSGGVVVFEGGEVVDNKSKSGEGDNIYVEDKDGKVVLIR